MDGCDGLFKLPTTAANPIKPHTCLYKHVHVLIPYLPMILAARLRAALASEFAAICLQAVICMSNSSRF